MSPIRLITSMISDPFGQHKVLLPINHNHNKICDISSFFKIKTQAIMIPPKCIENTFKSVQSTFDRKMHSKQRLHKFSQEG